MIATNETDAVAHPLLVWLRHVIEQFDRIYVRRQDPQTRRWGNACLAELPLGEAFSWIAYWAIREQTPIAVPRNGRRLDLHPVVAWLSHLVEHFDRIYVQPDDPPDRYVRLCDLTAEEAFSWIAACASGPCLVSTEPPG